MPPSRVTIDHKQEIGVHLSAIVCSCPLLFSCRTEVTNEPISISVIVIVLFNLKRYLVTLLVTVKVMDLE